ncbi:MAG: folylpolyglutamate synthase/dihydrofolate synthase family protein [Kiloniellales bacterium]|nr:folylpolyglutamate synthase/dihydrofolate synthase family protein [Kiloniellales bacterium]
MAPGRSIAKPPSDAILERLSRLHPKIIDLSLGRVERLLARLGRPEAQLPPVVHVAGTNGKGSVIAYLRAMLEAAGKRVQAYTSPHLVSFHERIRLAEGLIPEAELAALLEDCEAANGAEPITYFEITTVAAFLAFARHPADVLLLEVGLGGRLDATNVIERPALSVITPVSIDHTQFLGESLEAIAFEKAGILKPGMPAVVGPQAPAARAAIEAQAVRIGAPLFLHGRDWDFTAAEDGGAWTLRLGERHLQVPAPALPGGHQVANAAIALACAERLEGFGLDATARRRGLAEASWPGRLQELTEGALLDALPEGWELWLDGGHNVAAAESLARMAAGWRDRPLHIVYAMMRTKAVATFLRLLGPGAASLSAVPIPGEAGALSAAEAAEAARAVGFAASPFASVSDALAAIVHRDADGPARVLICGSLYLAGRVLAENGTPPG